MSIPSLSKAMAQAALDEHGVEANPVDHAGLCLLSLDGGGVRGLSSLYILKTIMSRLNRERLVNDLPPVKPCDVFDLIGGTSTGGLIAIMLGRLEMDVDECITEYTGLMKAVFKHKSSRFPIGWSSKIKPRFDSARLKAAIESVTTRYSTCKSDLFNDRRPPKCRAFVCTTSKETAGTTRLRSYSSSEESSISATVSEAALATSAATTFFDPVFIGSRRFVDGALGVNNPVEEVEEEASNIWCSESRDLKPLVKCFISIGTGVPGKKAIEDRLAKFVTETLAPIAAETKNTERRFIARWAQQFDEKRYFRFNVEQGLQGVSLEEYKEQGLIQSASDEYLQHTQQTHRLRDCVSNLKQKQLKTDVAFATVIHEHNIRTVRHKTNPRNPHWVVPFERNHSFVGREAQLESLDGRLFAKDKPSRIAVTGLGGVGKTQIAIELAFRTREMYPDCSVFWIPATNIESLQQAYLALGEQLGIPPADKEQANIKKLVQHHLSQEFSGRWLLIFDNADDIDMWFKRPESEAVSSQLKDYIPRSSHGFVVFTTRSKKVAVKLAQQSVMEVTEMNEDVALQLLRQSLINQALLHNQETATELLRQLTFLPLAIVQAAAYINENGVDLAVYLSLLEHQEQEAIDLLSEEFEDEGRYADVRNPIATTWLISFEQIRQIEPSAANLLSFMACIGHKNIQQAVLPPAKSQTKRTTALGLLQAYSFVKWRPAECSFDVHRLVHLATRNWLKNEQMLEHWTTKATSRLASVFPDDTPHNRDLWRAYLPHAIYVLDNQLNMTEGRFIDAEEALSPVMETVEILNQEATVILLKNLFNCLMSDGRYIDAEESLSPVIEAVEKLDQDDPNRWKWLDRLAWTYSRQGRWNEAEKLDIQVLEARKRLLGEEHPETVISMGNLALTLSDQGRSKEAEELVVQVLEIKKRVFGPEHPETLISMGNLASTLWRQGRWEEAEELEVQVLEIRKRVFGPEHPETLISMGNLASTLWRQGRWEEAEELEVQVLDITKRVLGPEHPNTLISMGNLASTLWRQGRWEEAEELEVQVLEIEKRVFGPEHPETLTTMNNLAWTWKDQCRDNEAVDLLTACVQGSTRTLGMDHPRTKKRIELLDSWTQTN